MGEENMEVSEGARGSGQTEEDRKRYREEQEEGPTEVKMARIAGDGGPGGEEEMEENLMFHGVLRQLMINRLNYQLRCILGS